MKTKTHLTPVLLLVPSKTERDFYTKKCIPQDIYQVSHVESLSKLKNHLEPPPELIIVDLNMGESKGLKTFYELQKKCPNSPIIVISDREDPHEPLEAIEQGAYNYFKKKDIHPKTFVKDLKLVIDRHRRENALKQSLLHAQNDLEHKSQFVATLSHEIRNPLNAIAGITYLLAQNSSLSPMQKDLVQRLKSASDFVVSLVNNVLDLEKIQFGSMRVERNDINIRHLVKDCLDLYSIEADKKNVILSDFVHPDVPRVICSDDNRIRQVLMNLLSNALKYAPSEHIQVEVSYQENQVTIAVEDQGPGIPKEKLGCLFKPFSQVKQEDCKKGTGLGLSICRKIANLLGGDIHVTSTLGKGSKFYFSLQDSSNFVLVKLKRMNLARKRVLIACDDSSIAGILSKQLAARHVMVHHLSHEEDTSKLDKKYDLILYDKDDVNLHGIASGHQIPKLSIVKNPMLSEEYGNALKSPFNHFKTLEKTAKVLGEHLHLLPTPQTVKHPKLEKFEKVLIVDDEEVNGYILKKMLKKYSKKVHVANNGDDAIHKYTQNNGYDMVFMDCSMPQLNGMEAAKKIKEIDSAAMIVAVSGKSKIDVMEQSGVMDYFLAKPVSLNTLDILIEKRSPAIMKKRKLK